MEAKKPVLAGTYNDQSNRDVFDLLMLHFEAISPALLYSGFLLAFMDKLKITMKFIGQSMSK